MAALEYQLHATFLRVDIANCVVGVFVPLSNRFQDDFIEFCNFWKLVDFYRKLKWFLLKIQRMRNLY